MHPTKAFILAAGSMFVLTASHASADVLIHLRSGDTIRASRYWIEGEIAKVQARTGTLSFPRGAIASVEEVASLPPDTAAPAARAGETAPPQTAGAGETAPPQPAAKDETAPPKPAAAAETRSAKADASRTGGGSATAGGTHAAAPATVDADLKPVPNEDLEVRMARLDKLSLTTHRALAVARREGAGTAETERLQRRLDEINRQRNETLRRLGAIR